MHDSSLSKVLGMTGGLPELEKSAVVGIGYNEVEEVREGRMVKSHRLLCVRRAVGERRRG
jgi:hypothetical protein